MQPEELSLVRQTLNRALGAHKPEALVGALEELGFFELAGEEPAEVWGALFDVQGEECIASPALDLVVLDALGLGRESAVVYPAPGAGCPPPGSQREGTVVVDGVMLAGAERAESLTVAVAGDDGVQLATLAADSPGLTREPIHGLDPDLGLVALRGEAEATALQPAGDGWDLATSRARLALAHEITGASRSLLTMAVEHVKNREQFGAPIAVFQAVKHRLAEVHVAVEASRSVLEVAWLDDDPFVATLAKAVAGRTIAVAVRNCQQVCGAIGFTWEFGLHRFVRRGLVLQKFLESATTPLEIASRVAQGPAVPRLRDLAVDGAHL